VTTQQTTTRVVPAGWYQDPADDTKVRWWNGLTWTEHVEFKPAGAGAAAAGALAIESTSPADALTMEQRTAEARELEHQYGISSGESDTMTRRAAMMLDARGPSTGTIPIQGVAAPRRAIRTTTPSVWLLAIMPVITSLLSAVAAYIFFYVTPTPLVAAIGVVLFLLSFLWAVGDARTLQNRGLSAPSPLWALALPLLGTLLYLVMRRRAVTGSAPLIAFLVLVVVALAGPVAIGAAGAAPSITKALEVQRAVSDDLVGSGVATSVSCPPIVESTSTGTVFTCDAVLVSGLAAHVWVSFDNDQGQFSWALANR
jgi:hypothetical protein